MKIRTTFKLNWAIQPLSRFLVVYFLGLLLSYLIPINFWVLLSCIICTLITLLVSLYYKIKRSAIQTGLSVCMLILLSGALHGLGFHTEPHRLVNDAQFNKQPYLIRINSEPIRKDSSVSFGTSFYPLDSLRKLYPSIPIQVKTTIYQPSANFQIGEYLLVYARLSEPQRPHLPGEFNYQAYLRRTGIDAIARLDSTAFLKLSKADFSFKQYFIQLRNNLIHSFEENGMREDELAIASALLLGARSDISEDLNEAYSQSGITHILAVSGMHVGLVFTAIGFFFKKLRNKYLVCFLSIAFLWSYACLTGLSASVTRAAWMFSFIACGNLFRSGQQKWNSISASALLMLVLDPFVWLDPGFQLSFAAVWGIVSLGKLPEKFNRLPKWLRLPTEAAWVSCVAQLFTLPVSLLIFGKFPVYFLLANLITVPLSTILTYWGIITIFLLPIPAIASIFCKILSYGIQAMNFVAYEISKLPFSTFDDLYLSIVQASWLAIVLYICSAKFISRRQKFKWTLIYSCLASILLWIQLLVPTTASRYLYASSHAIGIIEHNESAINVHILNFEATANSYSNRSINTLKKYAIQNQLAFKQAVGLNENIARFSCQVSIGLNTTNKVFFIHPENLRVNPFATKLKFRTTDKVVLLPGGAHKKRQLWRLALLRKRVQWIDAQANKIEVKKIM
jgi:competence protein ComEC